MLPPAKLKQATVCVVLALVIATTTVSTATAEPSEGGLLAKPVISGTSVKIDLVSGKSGDVTYQAKWDAESSQLIGPAKTASFGAVASKNSDRNGAYAIYSVNPNGVIVGRGIVQSAPHVVDTRSGQMPVQWAATNSAVGLAWWKPYGADIQWTISRDGKVVARTDQTSWVDSSAETSRKHTYTVTGFEMVAVPNGSKAPKPYFYEVETPKIDRSAIGRRIDDPGVLGAKMNADLVPPIPEVEMYMSYRAFISTKYIDAPLFCVASSPNVKYYNGNSRGFSGNAYENVHNAKSEISRVVGFTTSSFSRYPLDRFTGDTITYDSAYRQIERKNAGTTSYETIVSGTDSSTHVEGRLVIHATNPLCTAAPAIDGSVYYEIDKSGLFLASGTHDQAPSHEILYLWNRNGNESTGYMHRRSLNSFYCLAPTPACPSATFSVSKDVGSA